MGMTREQVVQKVNDSVNEYFDAGSGWAAAGGLRQRLDDILDTDAALRTQLEAREKEAKQRVEVVYRPIIEQGKLSCTINGKTLDLADVRPFGTFDQLQAQLAAALATIERLDQLTTMQQGGITDLHEQLKAYEGGALHDELMAQCQLIDRLQQRVGKLEKGLNWTEDGCAMLIEHTSSTFFKKGDEWLQKVLDWRARQPKLYDLTPPGAHGKEGA